MVPSRRDVDAASMYSFQTANPYFGVPLKYVSELDLKRDAAMQFTLRFPYFIYETII